MVHCDSVTGPFPMWLPASSPAMMPPPLFLLPYAIPTFRWIVRGPNLILSTLPAPHCISKQNVFLDGLFANEACPGKASSGVPSTEYHLFQQRKGKEAAKEGKGGSAGWEKKKKNRGNMIDLLFQGLSPRTILTAIGKD